jgi:hypothetical protein
VQTTPPENPESPELQFDSVEYAEPGAAATACVACHRNIAGEYYEINGQLTCPVCRGRFEQAFTGGSRFLRFVGALLLGGLAGLLGAAIYFGVAKLTGYEIGLVALVVGFLVGGGVRKGCGGRGGWFYQCLAIFLTYASISLSYAVFFVASHIENAGELADRRAPVAASAPSAASQPASQSDAPASQPGEAASSTDEDAPPAWLKSLLPTSDDPNHPFEGKSGGEIALSILALLALMGLFVLSLPIIVGVESPIAFLIVGFGVYTAWKINRRVPLNISGPYQIAAQKPPSPPSRPPVPDSEPLSDE